MIYYPHSSNVETDAFEANVECTIFLLPSIRAKALSWDGFARRDAIDTVRKRNGTIRTLRLSASHVSRCETPSERNRRSMYTGTVEN